VNDGDLNPRHTVYSTASAMVAFSAITWNHWGKGNIFDKTPAGWNDFAWKTKRSNIWRARHG
jgi:hypothetical protein